MSVLSDKLRSIADSRRFNYFITFLIFLTSFLIGMDTYPSIHDRYGAIIDTVDGFILACFVVEILIRFGAEGLRPWRYFSDPWNIFDFLIVGICLLPLHTGSLAIIRLIRVLRVLRLLKAMPRLRMIVQGMLNSISSIGYIAAMLFMHFYLFAVLGVCFFGDADPVRFGRLHSTMLTLFQVITLENWPDTMHLVRQVFPWWGPAYFIVFIIVGTMVIMNLFIGVIVSSMHEAVQSVKNEKPGIKAPAAGGSEPGLGSIIARLEQLGAEVAQLTRLLKDSSRS